MTLARSTKVREKATVSLPNCAKARTSRQPRLNIPPHPRPPPAVIWAGARRTVFPAAFLDVVSLEIGAVAEPSQDSSGFHIVKMIDKRGASQQRAEQTLVRHILLSPSAIRSDEQTRVAIEEIRSRIVDGGGLRRIGERAFRGSRHAIGRRGPGLDNDPKGLDPAFQRMMNLTGVDELSEAFQSSFGWHILEVRRSAPTGRQRRGTAELRHPDARGEAFRRTARRVVDGDPRRGVHRASGRVRRGENGPHRATRRLTGSTGADSLARPTARGQ